MLVVYCSIWCTAHTSVAGACRRSPEDKEDLRGIKINMRVVTGSLGNSLIPKCRFIIKNQSVFTIDWNFVYLALLILCFHQTVRKKREVTLMIILMLAMKTAERLNEEECNTGSMRPQAARCGCPLPRLGGPSF